MSRLPEASCDNSFENCVSVQLYFDRPQIFAIDQLNLSGQEEVHVSMTIQFGQEQFIEIDIPLFGGKVYFGIRRGELELTLENCLMPASKVIFHQSSQQFFEVEIVQEEGSEIQAGIASSTITVANRSEKIKNSRLQIEQVGGEQSPTWIFQSNNETEPLLGQLLQKKLGTIDIKAKPCKVTATFATSGEHVWINRDKVELAEDQTLSSNRMAVMERLVAINCIGKKLDEPLSKVIWQYV